MTISNKKSMVITLWENVTRNNIFIYGLSQVFSFRSFLTVKGERIVATLKSVIGETPNITWKGNVIAVTQFKLLNKISQNIFYGKHSLSSVFSASEKWASDILFGKTSIIPNMKSILRLEKSILSFGKTYISAIFNTGYVYKFSDNDPHTLGELDGWTVGGIESRFGSTYYLYDQFITDRSAGAINTTSAEPTGGTRTVTDTNNKITISGQALNFATGAVANDGIWYPSLARLLGRTLITTVNISDVTSSTKFGWDTNTSGSINDNIHLSSGTVKVTINGGSEISVDSYFTNQYQIAVVMRVSGTFYFIKGGTFTNWTMLYNSLSGTASGYPSINTASVTSIFSIDNLKNANSPFTPDPLVSDGFSDIATDGKGNPENNGVSGLVWTNSVGTWTVSGGSANASSLVSSVGVRTIPTATSSIIGQVEFTRPTGGRGGLVLRYQDSSNYIIAYHDNTNCKVDKIVAGTPTNMITGTPTYGAGKVILVSCDSANTFRLFYDNVLIGSPTTITEFSTSKIHGLYTTDITNTLDNFVIWGRGENDEYFELDVL